MGCPETADGCAERKKKTKKKTQSPHWSIKYPQYPRVHQFHRYFVKSNGPSWPLTGKWMANPPGWCQRWCITETRTLGNPGCHKPTMRWLIPPIKIMIWGYGVFWGFPHCFFAPDILGRATSHSRAGKHKPLGCRLPPSDILAHTLYIDVYCIFSTISKVHYICM